MGGTSQTSNILLVLTLSFFKNVLDDIEIIIRVNQLIIIIRIFIIQVSLSSELQKLKYC